MTSVVVLLLGVIAYSLVEYIVHRWLLHGPMKAQHREHHRDPTKHIRVPLMIVAPVLALVFLVVSPALAVGMLACWAGSGVLHRKLHTTNLTMPWLLRLQHHHMRHHRRATMNYGVSSVLWDKLFRTLA